MGVTINKKSTTTEPLPQNAQANGGLNAFYWYQIFGLDSGFPDKLHFGQKECCPGGHPKIQNSACAYQKQEKFRTLPGEAFKKYQSSLMNYIVKVTKYFILLLNYIKYAKTSDMAMTDRCLHSHISKLQNPQFASKICHK